MDPRFLGSSESDRPVRFGSIYPPDDAWLELRPAEPIRAPWLPVIDAHHHLWSLPGNRYLLPEFAHDLDSGHRVVASVHVECGSYYRAWGPEILRPVGETERIVHLTEQDAPGLDTRVAAAIVGFADLNLGSAVEQVLEAHLAAGRGRFRGIRFGTGWDDSPDIENTQSARRPDMLGEPRVREGVRRLADLGLTLDAWLFHTQLDEVASLADAVPHLQIILDHCGGPLGYGPYATNQQEHFEVWQTGIAELARRPNVVCKLGGLLARGAAFDYPNAARPPTSDELAKTWAPWIETCIEHFGAQRCMFESNFPVEKMGTTYSTLWNAFKKFAASATATESRWLFAKTARSIYRIDTPGGSP